MKLELEIDDNLLTKNELKYLKRFIIEEILRIKKGKNEKKLAEKISGKREVKNVLANFV